MQRREAAPGRAPIGMTIEKIGASQCDHQDAATCRALNEVDDEIEETLVRPLQILEDENHRAVLRLPLKESPQRPEQVFATTGRHRIEPEQACEARHQPSA